MYCRICNNKELTQFYCIGDKNQFKYYKCKNCGLVNLDLTDLKISEHQNQYFRRFKPREDYDKDRRAQQVYKFIKRYVAGKGKYLDIGCGGGNVLYQARKDGWEVKGIEISPSFAEYVRERLNIEVDVADFMEYDTTGDKFDLVSLRHVLEHLPDSILVMNKIHDLLKDNGFAHLEFPNINSITHRIKRYLARTGIHKKKYGPTFLPGHCNEFSKATFIYLLNKTGFSLIRWETYSFKPFKDFIYNRIHIEAKARTIIKKM